MAKLATAVENDPREIAVARATKSRERFAALRPLIEQLEVNGTLTLDESDLRMWDEDTPGLIAQVKRGQPIPAHVADKVRLMFAGLLRTTRSTLGSAPNDQSIDLNGTYVEVPKLDAGGNVVTHKVPMEDEETGETVEVDEPVYVTAYRVKRTK